MLLFFWDWSSVARIDGRKASSSKEECCRVEEIQGFSTGTGAYRVKCLSPEAYHLLRSSSKLLALVSPRTRALLLPQAPPPSFSLLLAYTSLTFTSSSPDHGPRKPKCFPPGRTLLHHSPLSSLSFLDRLAPTRTSSTFPLRSSFTHHKGLVPPSLLGLGDSKRRRECQDMGLGEWGVGTDGEGAYEGGDGRGV